MKASILLWKTYWKKCEAKDFWLSLEANKVGHWKISSRTMKIVPFTNEKQIQVNDIRAKKLHWNSFYARI